METNTSTQTRAAVAVLTADGHSIGYADEGVAGYTPTTYTYATREDAKAAADAWNMLAGLDPKRAASIVLSTMRL